MDQENHINYSHFKGVLTRKPVLKGNERKCVLLNLSCKRGYQNENGKEVSDYITFKLWNDAESVVNEFEEGQLIDIEAHTRTGSYINEQGDKVYTSDLIVDKYFIEKEKENDKSKENNKNNEMVK